jgi:hypothetical protein
MSPAALLSRPPGCPADLARESAAKRARGGFKPSVTQDESVFSHQNVWLAQLDFPAP